ncbi:DMT family transporter [Acididesulfobacillus acetoxydans]|uniref:DMT family transporter n=1 Tax=Acididesulfobacillus acetoxydans TaxID=1561005 RepID=UPI001F0FC734|nr:DMT family transporter [Acididesulfobacillus acetoxydans]
MWADLLLIFVALIWGLSFTAVKDAIGIIPPMEFIGLRFMLSALVLGAIFFNRLKKMTRHELLAGCVIGLFLALGFLAQTIGLAYTTPGKSGFLTSLYIIIVPFLTSLFYKKFVGWMPIAAAVLAFVGVCLISLAGNDVLGFGQGDLLSILCAFAFALQILAVAHYVKRYNVYVLTVIQIVVTGIISLGYSFAFEPVTWVLPATVWLAMIYTGLMATCFAFLAQNFAQRHTSSSHAALLLGLEAPFSLLFSVIIWGEVLTARSIIGSSLIFAAILLVEVIPSFWQPAGERNTDTTAS